MEKASLPSIMTKAFIGFIMTFIIAFVSMNLFGIIFSGFLGLLLVIVFSIITYALFNAMKNAQNSSSAMISWLLYNILLGMTTGNTILVTVYYTGLYTELNSSIVLMALLLAFIGTSAAVIGVIILLPTLMKKETINQPLSKIVPFIFAFLAGYSIVYFIAWILALFGLNSLWLFLTSLIFGVGPVAIVISILFTILAFYKLVQIITYSARSVDFTNKAQEYFLASLITTAMINTFLELFKLILKILARRNERN